MPGVGYMLLVVVVAGAITLLLRALPFAVLAKLRSSRAVRALGRWMPVGILLILFAVTVRDLVAADPHRWWIAVVSILVTIATHLLTRRRTVWSVAAGTACYVLLVNLVPL